MKTNTRHYTLKIFLLSFFFGLLFIGSNIYSIYRNILVVDCGIRFVRLGAYRWRKDRLFGHQIQEVYSYQYRGAVFQTMFRMFTKNDPNFFSAWFLKEINRAIEKADVRSDEVIVIMNYRVRKSLSQSNLTAFENMKASIVRKYQNHFKTFKTVEFTPYWDAVSTYLSIQSLLHYYRGTENKKLFLLNFETDHLLIAKEAPVDEKINEPMLEQEYYPKSDPATKLIVKAKECFGQFEFFSFVLSSQFARELYDTIYTPCLKKGTHFDPKILHNLLTNLNCIKNIQLKNLITGMGNETACEFWISKELSNSWCANSLPENNCVSEFPQLDDDTQIVSTYGPVSLLKILNKISPININHTNFESDYNVLQNEICNGSQLAVGNLKIDLVRLELFCWEMSYYKVMFEKFGVPLSKWKHLKFTEKSLLLLRGIASLVEQTYESEISLNSYLTIPYIYFILALISLFGFYLSGLFQVSEELAQNLKTLQVFSRHENAVYQLNEDRSEKKIAKKSSFGIDLLHSYPSFYKSEHTLSGLVITKKATNESDRIIVIDHIDEDQKDQGRKVSLKISQFMKKISVDRLLRKANSSHRTLNQASKMSKNGKSPRQCSAIQPRTSGLDRMHEHIRSSISKICNLKILSSINARNTKSKVIEAQSKFKRTKQNGKP